MSQQSEHHKAQLKHIVAEQSLFSAAVRASGLLLGLITTVLITKFWGAQAFGEFRIALSTIGILLPICTLGLNAGLVKFLPHFQFHRQWRRLSATLTSTFSISFIMSCIVTAGLYLYHQSQSAIEELSSLQRSINIAMWLISPLTMTAMINAVYTSYKKTHWGMFFINVFARIAFLSLLGLSLLSPDRSGPQIVTLYLVAQYCTTLAFLYFSPLKSIQFTPQGKWVTFRSSWKKVFRYSSTMFLSLMVLAIHEAFDTLALAYFKGAEETGIYNLCLRICEVSYVFTFAFMTILAPIVSELYSASKKQEMETLLQQTTDWLFTLSLPLTLGLAVFAADFLAFFGPEFLAGEKALILLSLSSAGILLLAVTVKCALSFCGKEKLVLIDAILALTINISLNVFLIPRYGGTGAALANFFTMASMALIFFFQATRVLDLHPLRPGHCMLILNIIVILGILFAGKTLLPSHWATGIACIGLAWMASIGLTFWRTPNKQNILKSFWDRWKSGATLS